MAPSSCRYAALLISVVAFQPLFAQSPQVVTLYGAFPTVGLIQSEFSSGARELRFRELILTDGQVARLMDPDFLRQVADSLYVVGDGARVEIQVETVDGRPFALAVDRRNELFRARIIGARFASGRDGKRLLKQLKPIFGALEIRGTDGDDRELKLAAHKHGVDGSDLPAEPSAEPEPQAASQRSLERDEHADRPDVEIQEQVSERLDPPAMQPQASPAPVPEAPVSPVEHPEPPVHMDHPDKHDR